MNLAIIPARGGSKRIPRKNIRSFCGKPMIVWSIEAALKSDCFDKVVVSTDDQEMAEVAIAHGAEVPFLRPKELADDYAGTMPVIRHAIEQVGGSPSFVCCLYATAPFVTQQSLQLAYAQLQHSNADYAFSVASFAFPIQRALKMTPDKRVEMFFPEHGQTRSQDLEHAYHDAGQFYWGRTEAWLSEKSVFSLGSIPIVLPRHQVQDIDSEEDWQRAEWLFKAMQAEGAL